MVEESDPSVVALSSRAFVAGCAATALLVLVVGAAVPPPTWLLAAEIFATIIGLFAFGSFRYQIHKNALTFGMALVIVATFFRIVWPGSALQARVATEGWTAWLPFLGHHLLTWEGLDALFHADTLAFILGLTFFVAVIAQTRLLETITFFLLRRNAGAVLPTVLAVTGVVAFSSGILDGVSMIGLTIRTLVIVLFLARTPLATVRFAVMVCTVVTTVCGMWLAYGEPPNLIMKANVVGADGETLLTNGFFLRYCLPAAVASYLVVAWNLRRRVGDQRVDLDGMDIVDAHAESVRFLQAERHGEVLTPVEMLEAAQSGLEDPLSDRVQERVRAGEPLGEALVRERVPEPVRRRILGHVVTEQVAASLDAHYVYAVAGDAEGARARQRDVSELLTGLAPRRRRAQRFGLAALGVFVALLVVHAWNHEVPLFVASFAGFAVSLAGIAGMPRMRRLALHEARTEFAEYYFLFPLFLSIALLHHTGFFAQLQDLLEHGTASAGAGVVAIGQFVFCTVLSALLDNNVVADFGSRAILGLEVAVIHLFAMAQIAGYAAGGCWTHIGSAQSVVAFAFIRRDVDERYTPVSWIRDMTPVILEVAAVLAAIIYAESLLLAWLH